MKKKILAGLFFWYSVQTNAQIVVRLAEHADLPTLMELDHRVTYEYFLPLAQKELTHIPFWNDPQQVLEKELISDVDLFTTAINAQETSRLLLAWDTEKLAVAGFLYFQKKDTTLIFELIMLDAPYRGCGIGNQLVQEAIQMFPDIKTGASRAWQCNVPAVRFHKKLGFNMVEIAEFALYASVADALKGAPCYRMLLRVK